MFLFLISLGLLVSGIGTISLANRAAERANG